MMQLSDDNTTKLRAALQKYQSAKLEVENYERQMDLLAKQQKLESLKPLENISRSLSLAVFWVILGGIAFVIYSSVSFDLVNFFLMFVKFFLFAALGLPLILLMASIRFMIYIICLPFIFLAWIFGG